MGDGESRPGGNNKNAAIQSGFACKSTTNYSKKNLFSI
jgi:hypothetical protein